MMCNFVTSLLLLSLSVSGTTNVSEPSCFVQIRVPRHTVIKARARTELKINCTVRVQGCHRIPRISWCKIYENYCKDLNTSDYIQTDWRNTTKHEGMVFLIFQNISMEDTALYRCKLGQTSVSHAINVTVTDTKLEENSDNGNNTSKDIIIFSADRKDEFLSSPTPSNTCDLNTPQKDDPSWHWPFVYICSGIMGLLLITLTVSLIYIIRCRGRKPTSKEMVNKNQFKDTQKSDLLLPAYLYVNSNLLSSVVYRA